MTDFRKSKLDDRYLNDPAFHELVKVIEAMISVHGFSPSEIREACFLAHYQYELENPKALDDRFRKNVEYLLNRQIAPLGKHE